MTMKPTGDKVELKNDVVSKSELKRQMHDLQLLGESLISLPKKQLNQLTIGEELYETIIQASEMKNDNGRRRQIQRIGKLMRHEDAEVIKNQLLNATKAEKELKKKASDQEQSIKQIVYTLVNESHGLTQFIKQYPMANRQLIRQLITTIKKEERSSETTSSRNVKRLNDEIKWLLTQH